MRIIRWTMPCTALVFVLLLLFAAAPASAQPAPAPGTPDNGDGLRLTVPVNLVFVGYDPQSVDRQALLAQLPATYDPVVRYPQFYGLPGRNLGLHYRFAYHTITAPRGFQDDFFHYLAAAGRPGNLTFWQQFYNDQQHNVLDVTGPVLYIDAPSVEAWLADHARFLDVDNRHTYTIFFVNWYSRPDFRFHVYTKVDEPDPDTGVNFGAVYDDRKMIAWGGTSSRTWFYDLSAGPEYWSANADVDDPDLNGDGVPDYRMPPIWEYRAGGYRAPAQLSADLGLVTRYVAIDLLFTPSPLYDPLASRPRHGGSKVVSVNMLEDDPASSGVSLISPAKARTELSTLEPYYRFAVNLQDYRPIPPGAQRAFRIFAGLLGADDCWNAYGTVFAELFCYFDAHLSQYPTPHRARDYVIHNFAFNTTDANMGQWLGLLGFADDDWRTGTPSYIFQFDSPTPKTLGYGFTETTIHENGHHLGLSHPHDGYDAATGLDYAADGPYYFAWSGDESHSVMSYIKLTNQFGLFNRDNMNRWQVAALLQQGDALLAQLRGQKNAPAEAGLLDGYSKARATALAQIDAWDFAGAAQTAETGYEALETAADVLGVALPAPAAPTAPIQAVPHQVDPVPWVDPVHCMGRAAAGPLCAGVKR